MQKWIPWVIAAVSLSFSLWQLVDAILFDRYMRTLLGVFGKEMDEYDRLIRELEDKSR